MSLSDNTLFTAPYSAARASFSEALAERACAGTDDRSYTLRDIERLSSDITWMRYLGALDGVALVVSLLLLLPCSMRDRR